MESGKQSSTSSEETDRSEARGPKRSYECTFCKRGFTNAQALGGHMNIHRKDRAKAKHHNTSSSLSSHHQNNEDSSMSSPQFFPPISSQPVWYNQRPVMEEQRNHSMYFHHSFGSNAGYSSSYLDNNSNEVLDPFAYTRSNMSSTRNQELLGANLSLEMSASTHLEDHEVRNRVIEDDEVDLELRLGHG
ncbi:hypothetical protein UlMin_009891 [Ulmus minor]